MQPNNYNFTSKKSKEYLVLFSAYKEKKHRHVIYVWFYFDNMFWSVAIKIFINT